jgi:hypothetical protein
MHGSAFPSQSLSSRDWQHNHPQSCCIPHSNRHLMSHHFHRLHLNATSYGIWLFCMAPKFSHSNNMVWRLCKHGSPYLQHCMHSEALHSWSVRVSSHSQGSGSDVSGSMHFSICTMICSLPSTNQHCTPFAVCSIQNITMRPLRSGLAINCTKLIDPTVVGCPRCTTTSTCIFPRSPFPRIAYMHPPHRPTGLHYP